MLRLYSVFHKSLNVVSGVLNFFNSKAPAFAGAFKNQAKKNVLMM
jgi:hypothetical protein